VLQTLFEGPEICASCSRCSIPRGSELKGETARLSTLDAAFRLGGLQLVPAMLNSNVTNRLKF
jgi:hypothetical protein